jgi:mono/diheme cytochrome c family protein
MKHRFPLMVFSFVALLAPARAADSETVDFQRQIRPLLSDNCFHCHGPDPETRMAGMRLDLREGAFGARPNGTPVVPGDPQKSLVIQRITHADAALRMPPVSSYKELTPDQIALIRRWVEQGAVWSEHWAFTALEKPALPAVKNESWARNPIDRFILARLEAQGLQPAAEADRRTLIRRATLDLTGLPPSAQDVEAFLADSSPGAYGKLIDRLMTSPAYGEHRARYWLDAARYADTHGLHIDNYREMWLYRDWVIEAFNRNVPFDRFTVEQLAGDLLENPTRDQLIATGFHRCNITTNEGGVIEDEVAAMYAKDRADTTGTVWLGLTVGCATCHDHKFDPIKQTDFYALTAFFRNTTQAPLDGNIYDTPPVLLAPSDTDLSRWKALPEQLAAAEDKLNEIRAAAQPKIDRWLQRRNRRVERALWDGPQAIPLGLDAKRDLPEGVSWRDREKSEPALELADDAALVLENVPAPSLDEPFAVSARFLLRDADGGRVLASQQDPADRGRGWRLEIQDGRPLFVLTGDVGQELGVRAKDGDNDPKAEANEWHHIVASYDGLRQRVGLQLYLDGKLLPTEDVGRALRALDGEIRTAEPLLLGARANEDAKRSGLLKGSVAAFRILKRSVTESEARLLALWDGVESASAKAPAQLDDREREALAEYFLARRFNRYQKASAHLEALREERRAILRRSPITHVMREKPDSEPSAHVLYRGMYDQPREKVIADTPSALPPMDPALSHNRLGLARWLVDERNPLTARVTVNRFWQEVFGAGMVSTAGDFGAQGEPPSHPELLDWLAVEFRESGWDVKKLFRLMLTSAAYRQAAAATAEKIDKDPDNRLLSRGPQFRMDGEVIRDYALAASGLLAPEIGGPSVKPYQPAKIWETVAMNESNTRFYNPDSGAKLYRRSLYTFWKRAAPPPNMTIFNAPTREECTVRRERTNTPLQALVTMNDPQFFEAARNLAENTLREASGFDKRLDFMSLQLLARPLGESERSIARAAFQDYLKFYDSHPAEARKAVAVGESKPDPRLDSTELAAWTMLANQLMNLDEVLNK